ncbi:MAG: hypothetical protein Q9223_003171 [Gallowayella weberi]
MPRALVSHSLVDATQDAEPDQECLPRIAAYTDPPSCGSASSANAKLQRQHTQPNQAMAEDHREDQDEDNEDHVEGLTSDRKKKKKKKKNDPMQSLSQASEKHD